MSVINEKILPKEINTDLSSIYLGNDKARFIRGIDYALYGDGTEMVYKPEENNKLYDTSFLPPSGENFAVGRKVSRDTNEIYVLAYNSNQNHFIYRIKNGKCEYVFKGIELGFVLDPLYFIMQGRIEVIVSRVGEQKKTFLIWTDNNDDQHFLCVEDSIATNSFDDTKFPYFKTKYPKREYTLLGLRAFTDCIQIKEVQGSGTGLNKLKYKPWKFRISGYDVYGRPLEHGKISAPFYISDCANDSTQCLDLTFDILSPLVDKLSIEFSNDCGANWKRHALIEKYEPCKGNYWERQINKTLTVVDNKLTYRFCPGEQCLSISPDQTKRNFNPLPYTSSSVVRIQNSIALLNNKYGNRPFGCDIMDNVKFSVENPLADDTTNLVAANRTIVVWLMIFNPYLNQRQGIWRKDGKNVFGGLGVGGEEEDGVSGSYGQYFGDPDAGGFIGYLQDGSVAVSKQYRYTGSFAAFDPAHPNQSNPNEWVYHGVSEDKTEVRSNTWIQRFEFKNVRPGKYVFRVAGHRSKLTDDFRKTSTYFSGIVGFQSHLPSFNPSYFTDAKEVFIDVCDKDYDGMAANQVVKIFDFTIPRRDINLARESKVSSGYIYETSDNGVGVNPMSLTTITMNISGDAEAIWSYHADYNGFWWSATKDKNHEVNASFMRKCQRQQMQVMNWDKDERPGWKETIHYATENYPDFEKEACNRIVVKGKVVDCDSGVGISGVVVGMTNNQFVTTDKDGKYSLVTYDWERIRNEQQVTHNDKIIFLTNARCRILACDGGTCLPVISFNKPSCNNCNDRIVNIPETKVRIDTKVHRGLQLGGRYPLGLGTSDWMDRKGFVQHRKEWMLDIPTVNEMGVWGYPRIKWQIDQSVTFDPKVERLYFYIGKNVKFTDFHSWVADRVQFIDATGNVNTIAPTQIRVYYSSLNEYNKQYNFSTNSTWQVIDEKDSLIITDTVQFIANGDFSLFPKNITALVRSDKQGSYFQIDYTDDLRDLKDGALFKFMREPECESTETFYEVCQTIDVVNGKPVVNFGYLDVFDSYFVNRQIPTPLVQVKKVKKLVAGTTSTYEEIDESETINILKNYGWPFEHHSPSDFWGNKCGSFGRQNVKNDLENVDVKATQLAQSGAMGENGLVNFLHYFDDINKVKDFGKEYDSITSAVVKGNQMVCICTTKTFVSVFDDNTVRISNDGSARALSGEKQFSNPQNTILFGCREQDRNVIATDGNVIMWVDGNESGLIFHDFANGENIVKSKFEGFIRRKIKSIDRFNKVTGKINRFLHGEINPKNGAYIFSDFKIGGASFVNNQMYASIEENETACVDIASKSLRRFAHYTPEMFASLPSEETDKQFFSFKNALPYSHYNNGNAYLKFFGTQCNAMIRVAMATDPSLFKNYSSVVVHCDNISFFGQEVITVSKQKSWIPRNWFKRVNKFWVAPFLCNQNDILTTDKKLTNGEKLRAKGVEVLFVSDPANSDKYFELTAIEINAIKG